jgi:hypothetical protein
VKVHWHVPSGVALGLADLKEGMAMRVLLLLAVASTLAAQESVRPPSMPAKLQAPSQVGRYTRGEMKDYGDPSGGVSVQYKSQDDSTSWATLYLYRREPALESLSPDSAVARQAHAFKETLEVQRSRGVYSAFEIAAEVKDSIMVNGHVLSGRRITYVYRRGPYVAVSFMSVYALGTDFIKVRGTVAEKAWEKTDLPDFARRVAAEAVVP